MSFEYLKRVILVLFGLVLAVLIVETLLRVCGWGYTYLQERQYRETTRAIDVQLNNFGDRLKNVSEGGELVVVCIGGSTTAMGGGNSWPRQLERILNNTQDQWSFRVINKGSVGQDTDYLLTHLPKWLQKYRPHFLLAMVGINDTFLDTFQFQRGKFLDKFRTYNLAEWITAGIKARVTEKKRDLLTANPDISQLHPRTISNLHRMIDLTTRHGAYFVAVQYALTKTDGLKTAIKHRKVAYISNYEIFLELLNHYNYEDFFIDKFGGNFGHATVFGNRVIADNVARELLILLRSQVQPN